MKKNWKAPEMEELDVTLTLGGTDDGKIESHNDEAGRLWLYSEAGLKWCQDHNTTPDEVIGKGNGGHYWTSNSANKNSGVSIVIS